MNIDRREFLKGSMLTIGGAYLSSLLGSTINTGFLDSKKSNNKVKKEDYLKDDFFLLSGNFFSSDNNFINFVKIIERLDNNISFIRGNKIDFYNNTIYIPYVITYEDIPKLINIIKNKTKSEYLNQIISNIKDKYLNYSFFLYKNSHLSTNKDEIQKISFNLFVIAKLYSYEFNKENIIQEYNNFLKNSIENDDFDKKIKDSILEFESRKEISNNKEKKILEIDKKELLEIKNTSIKNPKKALTELFKIIETHINNINIKNKEYLIKYFKTYIKTQFEVNIILGKSPISAINLIIGKINSILLKGNNKNKKYYDDKVGSYFSKKIEKSIQIEIKNDFEKTIYSLMIKNVPQKKILLEYTKNAFIGINNVNDIQKFIINNYVKKWIKEDELFYYNNLIKEKGNKIDIYELINSLPNPHNLILKKQIISISKTFETEYFKDIQDLVEKGDFKGIKDKVNILNSEEKKNIYFLLFSLIGEIIYYKFLHPKKISSVENSILGINENYSMDIVLNSNNKIFSILNSGNEGVLNNKIRESKYSEKNFEINHLNANNPKINCMLISSLMNIIIEEFFDLKGIGITQYSNKNGITNHMLNGIEFDNEILWIDVTNNIYSIVNKDDFSENGINDKIDFANTYFHGAYRNILIDEKEKNNNKKKIKFINKYLDFSHKKILK